MASTLKRHDHLFSSFDTIVNFKSFQQLIQQLNALLTDFEHDPEFVPTPNSNTIMSLLTLGTCSLHYKYETNSDSELWHMPLNYAALDVVSQFVTILERRHALCDQIPEIEYKVLESEMFEVIDMIVENGPKAPQKQLNFQRRSKSAALEKIEEQYALPVVLDLPETPTASQKEVEDEVSPQKKLLMAQFAVDLDEQEAPPLGEVVENSFNDVQSIQDNKKVVFGNQFLSDVISGQRFWQCIAQTCKLSMGNEIELECFKYWNEIIIILMRILVFQQNKYAEPASSEKNRELRKLIFSSSPIIKLVKSSQRTNFIAELMDIVWGHMEYIEHRRLASSVASAPVYAGELRKNHNVILNMKSEEPYITREAMRFKRLVLAVTYQGLSQLEDNGRLSINKFSQQLVGIILALEPHHLEAFFFIGDEILSCEVQLLHHLVLSLHEELTMECGVQSIVTSDTVSNESQVLELLQFVPQSSAFKKPEDYQLVLKRLQLCNALAMSLYLLSNHIEDPVFSLITKTDKKIKRELAKFGLKSKTHRFEPTARSIVASWHFPDVI